jgi:hypothetical protein
MGLGGGGIYDFGLWTLKRLLPIPLKCLTIYHNRARRIAFAVFTHLDTLGSGSPALRYARCTDLRKAVLRCLRMSFLNMPLCRLYTRGLTIQTDGPDHSARFILSQNAFMSSSVVTRASLIG